MQHDKLEGIVTKETECLRLISTANIVLESLLFDQPVVIVHGFRGHPWFEEGLRLLFGATVSACELVGVIV